MDAAVQAQAVRSSDLIIMRGLTSSLWPIHYKPLPDELLSCWLVRLAHGHGLKVQTFCNQIFGSHLQVWNRDIDRLAPSWLLSELSRRTGTSAEAALNSTLRVYEGRLYRKFRSAGPLPWILGLKMYHRKRNAYGLQFCPSCLAEDAIPYFRKQWRIAFNTVCAKHRTMLLDHCPRCKQPVAFHRLDMVKRDAIEIPPLQYCHACQFDLCRGPSIAPIPYDCEGWSLLQAADDVFQEAYDPDLDWSLDKFEVMHQLCRLMATRYKHVKLRQYVLSQIGCPDTSLTTGHISFEMRSVLERHHLLQLSAWLLSDFENRLTSAWRARAIRYSVLLKDFPEAPAWYSRIVDTFYTSNVRGNV